MNRINKIKYNDSAIVRYSMQLAMLNTLKTAGMVSDREYEKIKNKLREDYSIVSEISA